MKRQGTKLLLWLCTGLLFFGLIACEALYQNQNSGTPLKSGDTAGSSTTVSAEEQLLDETVFPKDQVIDVKITLDSDDFQDMLDNASAEEFKTASVDYNGQHFDNVGIRTKGNLSLRSVVQMEDSDRYSFKLSFDEYVNQTLNGIEKINLNNNYSDASYMREYLAYELAEQMGLPTPKFSYVNVYINDELWGFYLAVEQIGDAYLERHFGNAYGALYKGEMTGTGSELTWLGDDPDSYTGLALKSKTTNDDILIDMLDELNNGTDYEKYINVSHALGYIALNVLTNNTDSYIGGNKQNYYLYEDEGVFSILPWDYNMAFGGMGGGGMGGMGMGRGERQNNQQGPDRATRGNEAAAPSDEDNGTGDEANSELPSAERDENSAGMRGGGRTELLIDEPTQGAVAERPLVAKLLAVETYKDEYHNLLQQVIDGYLADENFSARVAELSDMISAYVEADPTSFYTYEEYQEAIPQLITTNANQVDSISQQLDGTIASSGDGSGSGGMGGMGGMMPGDMGDNIGGEEMPTFGAPPSDTPAQNGVANTTQGEVPTAPGENGQPPTDGSTSDVSDEQVQGDLPAAENNAGQQGAVSGDGRGRGQGGGFPGGDGMGGGPDGFGPGGTTSSAEGQREAVVAGSALLILLVTTGFVAFFRGKRL